MKVEAAVAVLSNSIGRGGSSILNCEMMIINCSAAFFIPVKVMMLYICDTPGQKVKGTEGYFE